MLVIGLTGGVGCGKSALAKYFQEFGITIIDTDEIAKELVAPNSVALQEIIQAFGKEILLADGTLNRKKMRSIIFNNKSQKQTLEAILHPKIASEVQKAIHKAQGPYCIVAIPLLVETQALFKPLLNRILVVESEANLQQQRLIKRDNLNEQEAQQMINSQASREDRLKIADDIIINNGSLNSLKAEARRLHQLYSSSAR